MRRFFLLGLLLAAALPSLRAETYQAWLSSAARQNGPIRFVPDAPWTVDSSFQGSVGLRLPETPVGATAGSLDLLAVPESDFPLTVTSWYDSLAEEQLRKSPRNSQMSDLLDRASQIGPPLLVRIDHIAAGDRSLDLPGLLHGKSQWGAREFMSAPYALRVEAVTAGGRSLGRWLPVEAAFTVPNVTLGAIALNDPVSDRFFHTVGLGAVTQKKALPLAEAAYDRTKNFWVDEASLADPKLDDAWFRRRLLSGSIIAGAEASARALGLRLGLGGTAPVLDGALLNAAAPLKPPYGRLQNIANESFLDLPFPKKKDEPSFLPVGTGLSGGGHRLGIYHLVVTGGFVLGVSLFLALFRKRNLRYSLWIVVPAGAALYSLLSIFLAPLVVPLGSHTYVAEYCFSRAGWPETRVETEIAAQGFLQDRFIWRLPPGSQPLFQRNRSSHSLASLEHRPDETLVTLETQRGAVASARLSSWRNDPPPCRGAGGDRVEFLCAFDKAWIWDGKRWCDAGKVAAGDVVALSGLAPVRHSSNQARGLSARVQHLFDYDLMSALPWNGTRILLAREAGARDMSLLSPAAARNSSVQITIHQFPSGDPAETPPAP
jgi:hypothetical protein